MQFTIRQLLITLTFVCVAFGLLTWLARNIPEVFFFACLGSFAIGLLGACVVILAGMITLSVYAAPETEERKLSMAKCANLAVIGACMMALPVLTAVIALLLVPLMHPT